MISTTLSHHWKQISTLLKSQKCCKLIIQLCITMTFLGLLNKKLQVWTNNKFVSNFGENFSFVTAEILHINKSLLLWNFGKKTWKRFFKLKAVILTNYWVLVLWLSLLRMLLNKQKLFKRYLSVLLAIESTSDMFGLLPKWLQAVFFKSNTIKE